MNKRPISVTLRPETIVWLRARKAATGARSLSETLDRVIQVARTVDANERPIRSAVGLVRLPADDPDLRAADAAVRALFANHLAPANDARKGSAPSGVRGRRGGQALRG